MLWRGQTLAGQLVDLVVPVCLRLLVDTVVRHSSTPIEESGHWGARRPPAITLAFQRSKIVLVAGHSARGRNQFEEVRRHRGEADIIKHPPAPSVKLELGTPASSAGYAQASVMNLANAPGDPDDPGQPAATVGSWSLDAPGSEPFEDDIDISLASAIGLHAALV